MPAVWLAEETVTSDHVTESGAVTRASHSAASPQSPQSSARFSSSSSITDAASVSSGDDTEELENLYDIIFSSKDVYDSAVPSLTSMSLHPTPSSTVASYSAAFLDNLAAKLAVLEMSSRSVSLSSSRTPALKHAQQQEGKPSVTGAFPDEHERRVSTGTCYCTFQVSLSKG